MRRICVLVFLAIGVFSSCREDNTIPVYLFFEKQNSLTAETIGDYSIPVQLNSPAFEDFMVNYTVAGSAQLGVDYTTPGNFVIKKDSLIGYIIVTIIDDNEFEFDPEVTQYFGETINFSLTSVSGNKILAGNSELHTHTLIVADNEPIKHSMQINLTWDAGDGTAGDVDMDLFVFLLDPQKGPIMVGDSQQIGTKFEGIVVGTPAPDADYGLGYRYFEGSSDRLKFKVKFIARIGMLSGNVKEKEYEGIYTLDNINNDPTENASVQIVQTFRKMGSDYIDFSEIKIPESGSRVKTIQGEVSKSHHIGNVVN
ncbi:MAG: Calx-beta domain-containing protein [Cyclobacteriaceae bacterium]